MFNAQLNEREVACLITETVTPLNGIVFTLISIFP